MDISLFPVGLALFVGVGVWLAMRYLNGRQSSQPVVVPVKANLPAIVQLVAAAFAGNKPMVKLALDEAFETEWKEGDQILQVLEYAIFEVEQRSIDPNKRAYVIEAIAKFTGLTEADVIEAVKRDLKPKLPAAPVVAPFIVFALLSLGLCGSAGAAYPSHINADIKGPQRFYPTPDITVVDPPLARDYHGQLVSLDVVYPRYATGDSVDYDELAHSVPRYDAPLGFMERGPVRRGALGIARGAARIITAPFRFLFRRGC